MFNARLLPTPRVAAPHVEMQGGAKKLLLAKGVSAHVGSW
jgi:hypothetical protein